MSDKIIYSDIDLTLLNFNTTFEDFLRGVGLDLPQGILQGHSSLSQAIGIPGEEADRLVFEFFDHPSFCQLPPLEYAQEATQQLYRDGWRFIGISACPVSVGAEKRQKNLEDALGIPFEEVHLSGFIGCKRSLLESFRPTVWVEDNVHNAHVGHELGYRTYLLNHLHNRDAETSVNRVESWKDIVEHLCTEA